MRYLIVRSLFRACNTASARRISSEASSSTAKEKWDIFAGVLAERLPVITKTLTPLEANFKTMLGQIEFENSLKSNHEIRKETEKRQVELLKAGKLDLDSEALKQTAQDLEDAYNDEFSKFKPAPRITEADKKNDTKSLNRKLEETLILLTEHKLGDKCLYILPQGKHVKGESLRQTAERVLKDAGGKALSVSFYGNAPIGFHKYKYPSTARQETVGAKIFFFRCVLKPQTANISGKNVKWQWLDQSELQKTLNEHYYQSVSQFLL
ncbi:39S ribosomal protein L46, mitochondrial [Toxorhynchites rutilus septentrionalis]|uniref:39S ribosomal protein L46, mitochondrial n=1 Tax=Toxorhynchites rutilus septentrionalis TaxID=329112 RepID=UPI0024794FB1|nr:39S ribosomal protein L46, mitochondrial [Toxorhynchites rutilus septentrionalis]